MVDVVGETATFTDSDSPVAIPATTGARSPLDTLRGKREALDNSLYLDLAVPRWDEVLGRRLWVRYRPGDPAVLQAAIEKREKSHASMVAKGGQGDPQRMTKANADFLVAACVAVYDLALDQEPPKGELPGLDEYPTFSSAELAEALGAPANAVATVRKVYATDGDLMIAASQLLEWSGTATAKADADFLDS